MEHIDIDRHKNQRRIFILTEADEVLPVGLNPTGTCIVVICAERLQAFLLLETSPESAWAAWPTRTVLHSLARPGTYVSGSGLLRAKKYTPSPSSAVSNTRVPSLSDSGFVPGCGRGMSNGLPNSKPQRLIFPIVSRCGVSSARLVACAGVGQWRFCPWREGRGG
jgi:hypothetical protein